MSATTDFLVFALLIGAGATAVMDIWAVVRRRLLGVSSLDLGWQRRSAAPSGLASGDES
ncbi:DUF2938 family protein [Sphingomonas sp. DT-204]|uniref:DUF2938 family protein n=1 Tax=Sphingomonas sp. DT-204 TaxID=3396166 RepID=UPI003F19C45A